MGTKKLSKSHFHLQRGMLGGCSSRDMKRRAPGVHDDGYLAQMDRFHVLSMDHSPLVKKAEWAAIESRAKLSQTELFGCHYPGKRGEEPPKENEMQKDARIADIRYLIESCKHGTGMLMPDFVRATAELLITYPPSRGEPMRLEQMNIRLNVFYQMHDENIPSVFNRESLINRVDIMHELMYMPCGTSVRRCAMTICPRTRGRVVAIEAPRSQGLIIHLARMDGCEVSNKDVRVSSMLFSEFSRLKISNFWQEMQVEFDDEVDEDDNYQVCNDIYIPPGDDSRFIRGCLLHITAKEDIIEYPFKRSMPPPTLYGGDEDLYKSKSIPGNWMVLLFVDSAVREENERNFDFNRGRALALSAVRHKRLGVGWEVKGGVGREVEGKQAEFHHLDDLCMKMITEKLIVSDLDHYFDRTARKK